MCCLPSERQFSFFFFFPPLKFEELLTPFHVEKKKHGVVETLWLRLNMEKMGPGKSLWKRNLIIV